MAQQILCKIFGHRIQRRRVRKDGDTYVGRCRWCRSRMEKGEDGWELRREAI